MVYYWLAEVLFCLSFIPYSRRHIQIYKIRKWNDVPAARLWLPWKLSLDGHCLPLLRASKTNFFLISEWKFLIFYIFHKTRVLLCCVYVSQRSGFRYGLPLFYSNLYHELPVDLLFDLFTEKLVWWMYQRSMVWSIGFFILWPKDSPGMVIGVMNLALVVLLWLLMPTKWPLKACPAYLCPCFFTMDRIIAHTCQE